MPNVVVIGAGIVGAACAYYASKAGLTVTVVDRNGVSGGTTGAGEGNILVSDKPPGPERLEELQLTLGEGPCIDAFALARPVLIPDLAAAMARWPAYAPAVYERGVRAVFAFPLQIGAARLGMLDVFRTETGMLTPGQLHLALAFAEVAVATLLDGHDSTSTGTAGGWLDDPLGSRAELFQAQGMVMVQLGSTLAEAMARMRAHAYAHDRRLGEVADDVVARRLSFTPPQL